MGMGKHFMRVAERFKRARNLLAAMLLFQALWLIAKWLSGNTSIWLLARTTSSWQKSPFLLIFSTVLFLAIALMPSGLVSKIRQLREHIVRNERLLLLTLCLVVSIAGLIYARGQPVGIDEQLAFNASKVVAEEGVSSFFAEYLQSPVGRLHPPLVPLLYGLVMRVFGARLLVIRFVSLLFTVGTILTTYFLGKALYDRDTGFAAALFLLAFPYFFRTGTAARTDMPMLFFFALGILLALRLLQTPTYRLAIGAGLVVGLGLLSRYTMVLICPVLLGYSLIHGSFRRCKIHLGIMALVMLTMLALWLVYAGGIGVLPAQLDTVVRHAGIARFTSDGSTWMSRVLSKWKTRLLLTAWPSALGAYNIPLLLLGGWHLTRRRNQSDWRILLWITVVSSLVILTTPVPRYALPIFPALAIVMAQALQSVPEGTERAGILALLYSAGAMYMYAG